MKKIFFLVCATVFCGLTGCGDTRILYTSSIDNQTKETIKIFFYGQTAYIHGCDYVICFPVAKNEYYTAIGSVNQIKKDNNLASCDPQINKEEVRITVSNGKSLNKDITSKNNWICETDDWNSYCERKFTVTEDDLE
jgi:hypothetical protein